MLKKFGHEIWTADGPDVAVVGFHYPTRMAVMRLSDGSLFIWSPIQLADSLRLEVDAVGQVRHIIAPNSLHHLFLPEWELAYPGAKVYAAPGLRKKRPRCRVSFVPPLPTAAPRETLWNAFSHGPPKKC